MVDLCNYNKRGPNQGKYELKPEYRSKPTEENTGTWRVKLYGRGREENRCKLKIIINQNFYKESPFPIEMEMCTIWMDHSSLFCEEDKQILLVASHSIRTRSVSYP